MVVNSINFLIFFIIVFVVYYFFLSGKAKSQNAWLLLSSYFFYGFSEWKMIPLLFISTLVFYIIGIAIGKFNETNEKKASVLTTVGTLFGVGILLYFKYLNFFVDSFSSFFNAIGLHTNWSTFHILMPLGISFFTFKLISYLIEVHRKHIEPCTDLISFATYISFFPTILSGPIDRPKSFLSQLQRGRTFDYLLASDGCRQILWGAFKKMVIADNIAEPINEIWGGIDNTSGLTLIIAAFLYAIQMYVDFSGYSDMAIGVGKLLGLRIAINFNYPFFALNVADYWRRWHMSLTSWLTDYIFMPLNIKFRNIGQWGIFFAAIINMVTVGMWHGANWTFALFGLYHGLLFVPLILSGTFQKKSKMKLSGYFPSWGDVVRMIGTFCLISLGLVFFRADSVSQAFLYITSIGDLSNPFFTLSMPLAFLAKMFCVLVVLFLIEWFSFVEKKEYGLLFIQRYNDWIRYLFYIVLCLVILFFNGDAKDFIYVQF